ILTAAISNRLYNHLQKSGILTDKQKGCRRASRGCKDQLFISNMIVSMVKKLKRKLGMAWIGYKKAFDSVPYFLILAAMRIYRVSPTIIQVMEATMKKWKSEMLLFTQ
ncbi:PREDICTED: uncharacterized protein LOC106820314, partial [Priapulus caudatus]|uniref:Uncharacterized protein LOC106820314 n=1 Tax=Priapulus caudatus TaxID=37621 RepID=A0ABM1F7A2_PRICU